MYLLVKPGGSKLWQMKYRHGGKARVYSIGPFSEIGLAEARAERDRAREWRREGKDPTQQRRTVKAEASTQQAATFRAIAEEWLAKQKYTDGHRRAQRVKLERDLYPYIGDVPIATITPEIALNPLRRIERRGTLETAAKVRRMASQIFRYAVVTSRATSDPAAFLSRALQSPQTQHRATIPFSEFPALFKALRAVPAELNTKLAIAWVLTTACRTAEMRFAQWGEIDGKVWRVPASRMKMRREHVVPLSRQAMAVLNRAREIRSEPGPHALLFPGFTRHGALSENALLALLARAGFFGRQTTHGFRSAFSTWAHEEHEAHPDIIESALAHVQGGVQVRLQPLVVISASGASCCRRGQTRWKPAA